jgi:hypothetical protein
MYAQASRKEIAAIKVVALAASYIFQFISFRSFNIIRHRKEKKTLVREIGVKRKMTEYSIKE